MICANFVDHLVFPAAEIERTERFDSALLGEALKTEDDIMCLAGNTRLFFTCSVEARPGRYERGKIELNHMAPGVSSSPNCKRFRRNSMRAASATVESRCGKMA
jgi:hypothetical protein